MTVLTAGAMRRAERSALRARLAATAPDGLVWLASRTLDHPEALRAERLPFPFTIGRVANGTGKHTVREVELVLQALSPDEDDATALDGYAHFVVATVPTIHARLTGRTLALWLERRSA